MLSQARLQSLVLSIERRPVIIHNDTLFLNLTRSTPRNYQFLITMSNMSAPGLTAVLEDKYTGTVTPLNMGGNTTANFSINTTAGSSDADRFQVVFSFATVLPVGYTVVSAMQNANEIAVNWEFEQQQNVHHYEVEKSVDALNFVRENTQAATSSSMGAYKWIDLNASDGYNYYRIKNVGLDGNFDYSRMVKVNVENTRGRIIVNPNPVTTGEIRLMLKDLPAGIYSASLFNSAGQVFILKELSHTGNNSFQTISLPQNCPAGVYSLEIVYPDKTTHTISVAIK